MRDSSRRHLYSAIAFVIAAATPSSNPRLAASPGQPPSAQTAAADIAPGALAQIEALIREKGVRSEAEQKIDSQLIAELRMERGQPIAIGVDVAVTDLPYANDGHVVVDVKARVTNRLVARLAALGIEVLSSDRQSGTLRVHLDVDQVETLAALPDVSFVQPQQQAQIHQAAPTIIFTQTGQGSRSSQGDVTHLAYAARAAFGANGSGIKIGVLSDGVVSLATSQASGDLGPVTVLPGQTGSGDEGTAMLEIIHDLAPGAQLYFATAFTSITSFANNIRALRAAGCDIIVDDVAYFVETPFQDGQAANVVSNTNGGVVIQAVNDVTADGALYFSSAGNSGHLSAGTSGTWEGDFVDGGPTTGLGGLTSGSLHRFGTQTFTTIVTPAASAPTNLSWSDPLGGSANDYDLFRLNAAGTAVVASSTNIQSGTQDPYEQLSSAGVAGERLVIVKKNSAAPRFLHVGTNRGVLSIATAGETHGHAAAAAAFDVAATPAVGPFPQPFNTTNVVETFSSDGPRRVFFEANGTPYTAGDSSSTGGLLRQKPDLTAADGVSVTGAGGFPSSFFGTSAAAPHAAAIAGLLKSANPALTPAQIRTLLTATAIDIGTPGADVDAGAGIVMADAVLRAAGAPGTALLEVTSVQATDNPGNGNGVPEAGEGASLIISLTNYGGASATAVSATLTSSSPGITITQPATRTYPDVAISGSASATPFLFTAASDFPCPQAASFTLIVTSADSPGPRSFNFQVAIGPPSYTITTTLDGVAPPGSPGVTTTTGLQTPRLTRNGVASSCDVSKPVPALFGTGTHQFDGYAFNTCANSVPSCVTVTLQGAGAANLFSASYSPAFVANSPQQNYKADVGASGALRTYAFSLPGGAQTFVVDVHEVDPGLGIGTQYTLNVAGACGGGCTANHVPVAIARDVTVSAGTSGTASASIDNGSSDADGDPLTITQSPAGPYPIGQTIVLLTVSDPQGATSQATATVTVVGVTTTTVVSASSNQSAVGQPVTFTATVATSGEQVPVDGSVTFLEGSTVLAGPAPLSGGEASFSTSSLSAGVHTISAFYSSASGTFASSNGSIVVTIGSGAAPAITTQPQSQTIPAAETATLTVVATGTDPLSYQWYRGASPTTTTPVGGATASTFTPPPSTSATSYWVGVSNPFGTADSATATITVVDVPTTTIVSASSNASIVGLPITFTATVAASGGQVPTDGSVTFAEGSTILAGPAPLSAGAASFSTSSLSVGAHTITASYSSASGTFAASTASIVVTIANGVAPAITTPPQSQTVVAGQTATLSVVATGTAPLSYQWYMGASPTTTTPIAGATASSFTTPPLTSATSYWVRVLNAFGTADSASATITAVAVTTTTVVSASSNSSIVGQPVTFTAAVAVSGGQAPTDGSLTFLEGSTILAGPNPLSAGAASFSTSSLTVGAHTITASYSSASGTFAASNGSMVVTIANGVAPAITTPPQSQTITAGQTATLSVVATGTAPLGYQWYTGASPTTTTPVAGATASSFTTPLLTSGTSYWVRVSNGFGTANSATATITVVVGPTTLLTPVNNGTPLQPVAFDWTDAIGATSYEIQVADSSTFTTPLIVDRVVTSSQFTTGGFAAVRNWWRVRAIDSAGTAGPWTAALRFQPLAEPATAALSAVALSPTSVAGGNTSQATATLTIAAPTGGAVVTLSSSNTAAATVPASVTVAAGATSATFTVTTTAVGASTAVTITGTSGGATKTATLTVTAPATLAAVSISPASVTGGTSAQGTVTLTSAAPTGGLTVTLSSDKTAATVPASVTVAAGATSALFTVTTVSVTASTVATITATAAGVTRTSALTIAPPAAAATLTVTVTGRSGVRVTSSPVGIDVITGGTAAASFATGTVVTLSVSNNRDAIWSGACSSGGNKAKSCSFTLTGTATVTANIQ